MSYDEVVNRVRFLVYGKDAWRVSVKKRSDGSPSIVFDAHGQTVKEARKTIHDMIRLIYCGSIELEIIHGFNHGTAIKEMIAAERFGDRQIRKYTPASNPGVTFVSFAA